eukprot:scaffold24077_cov117-Cylindrotheca_fusiformis.AAC.2
MSHRLRSRAGRPTMGQTDKRADRRRRRFHWRCASWPSFLEGQKNSLFLVDETSDGNLVEVFTLISRPI